MSCWRRSAARRAKRAPKKRSHPRGSQQQAIAGSFAEPRAEGVGFEPTEPVDPAQRFSRPPHSTTLPPLRGARTSLVCLRAEPDRARDAGAAQAAVAVRVLGQVLLVVGLGVVERAGGGDLGRDHAVTGRAQRRLVAVPRRLDRGALLVRAVVDGGAVLRADVIALAHALGRVVSLPERAQDLVVRDLRRVEHDEHDLGVAGRAAADLLVRRVRRVAARVAHRGRVDAVELPEQALSAPEAAHADDELLHLLGKRRRQRGAEDVVARRDGNRRIAAGERAFGLDHLRLLTEQEHGPRVVLRPYRDVTPSARAFTLGSPGRGGRVAEGTRLLSEYGEAISIAGSNPALSAPGLGRDVARRE